MAPAAPELELLRGTLDLLILRTLSWGPMHGLAVLQWIERVTREKLQVEEGALYPALHRMEDKGWLDAEWGYTDRGRKAKFYRLTFAGRRQLTAEASQVDEVQPSGGAGDRRQRSPGMSRDRRGLRRVFLLPFGVRRIKSDVDAESHFHIAGRVEAAHGAGHVARGCGG